jgi:hypothetical protein
MAVKAKIDPVEKVTAATLRADMTAPEQRRAAADFVRVGIAEADSINRQILGRLPPRTITVDGREGAALETVNPDGGQIIVEYDVGLVDAVRFIAETLVQRSPRRSGKYIAGHTLFADGMETTIGGTIPNAEEYTFLNTVPYARKIEIGKTKSGRAFVIQVPNRIYERAATAARSRFGNQAQISFTYRGAFGGDRVPAITVRHRR